MDWNQLDLEEIELDFNKSSKRIKLEEDENEMEIDLEFNLKEIQKKINTMRGDVRKLTE